MGRLIAAAGGIVLIISLFLSWYKWKSGYNAAGFSGSTSVSLSGWDALSPGDFLLLVMGAIAVLPAAFDIFDLEIELPVDLSVLTMGAGGLAALEIVFRILSKPGHGVNISGPGFSAGMSLSFGIFVALIAAAAVIFGGFTQMSEDDSSPTAYAGAVPQPPAGAPPAAPPPGPPSMPPPAPPAPPPPPPPNQPPTAT